MNNPRQIMYQQMISQSMQKPKAPQIPALAKPKPKKKVGYGLS